MVPAIITSCSDAAVKKVEAPLPLDQVPDGPVLTTGLIGCGGRGTGASVDFLNSRPNLQIIALGDTFHESIIYEIQTR